MPRLSVGTLPVEVAWRNPKRFQIIVEFVPSSIIAGNTGLVYGKWGSAPKADIASNTWDFVLNSGSIDGTNVNGDLPEAPRKEALWLVADTAGQICNIVERSIEEKPPS